MASIPIRNVILTAASGSGGLGGIMSAVWTDIGANSTWTQVVENNTTNPADQAFAIQSPDTTIQLNMINAAGNARLGINPDGATYPIITPGNPHDGVPNFSGTDGGMVTSLTPGAPTAATEKFILIEWTDAIMIITRDTNLRYCRGAYHWGKIWHQPITGLESTTGGTRLDGFACADTYCHRATNGAWWSTTATGAAFRRRCSLGQTNETNTALKPVTAWARHKFSDSSGGFEDGAYTYSGERLILPLMIHAADDAAADSYVWKYVRKVARQLPVFSIYTIDGVDTYMALSFEALSVGCDIAVPIIDGFDPWL